jgi:DNA-binding transcriptional LysR family regulator
MMRIIMAVNLSSIDLNLFLVLHAVLEERSATRAAARLNVTQSAVSNALARLRRLLDDPLVVRHGRGVVPTPRAESQIPAFG